MEEASRHPFLDDTTTDVAPTLVNGTDLQLLSPRRLPPTQAPLERGRSMSPSLKLRTLSPPPMPHIQPITSPRGLRQLPPRPQLRSVSPPTIRGMFPKYTTAINQSPQETATATKTTSLRTRSPPPPVLGRSSVNEAIPKWGTLEERRTSLGGCKEKRLSYPSFQAVEAPRIPSYRNSLNQSKLHAKHRGRSPGPVRIVDGFAKTEHLTVLTLRALSPSSENRRDSRRMAEDPGRQSKNTNPFRWNPQVKLS